MRKGRIYAILICLIPMILPTLILHFSHMKDSRKSENHRYLDTPNFPDQSFHSMSLPKMRLKRLSPLENISPAIMCLQKKCFTHWVFFSKESANDLILKIKKKYSDDFYVLDQRDVHLNNLILVKRSQPKSLTASDHFKLNGYTISFNTFGSSAMGRIFSNQNLLAQQNKRFIPNKHGFLSENAFHLQYRSIFMINNMTNQQDTFIGQMKLSEAKTLINTKLHQAGFKKLPTSSTNSQNELQSSSFFQKGRSVIWTNITHNPFSRKTVVELIESAPFLPSNIPIGLSHLMSKIRNTDRRLSL